MRLASQRIVRRVTQVWNLSNSTDEEHSKVSVTVYPVWWCLLMAVEPRPFLLALFQRYVEVRWAHGLGEIELGRGSDGTSEN
jgi:hypothetical protein